MHLDIFNWEMLKIFSKMTNLPQKGSLFSNRVGFSTWLMTCNLSVGQTVDNLPPPLVLCQRVRVCLSHLRLQCGLQCSGGVRAPLQRPAQARVLLMPPLLAERPALGHSHSGVAWLSLYYPCPETGHGKSVSNRALLLGDIFIFFIFLKHNDIFFTFFSTSVWWKAVDRRSGLINTGRTI